MERSYSALLMVWLLALAALLVPLRARAATPDEGKSPSSETQASTTSGDTTADDAKTDDATPEHLEFFEARVRPLLAAHCFQCHSASADRLEGGLRLDGRQMAITGGDSGPAVAPGKPNDSLIIQAIRWESLEMPPKGKLKESEVATLIKWVELGAPWPQEEAPHPEQDEPKGYDWEKWRSDHWAFQPFNKPPLPALKDSSWVRNDLDRFVLAKLDANGLKPAPPAEPRVLVRRIYNDLVGLPPAPAEVEAFLDAWKQNPDLAVKSLVDELLESPHYGERWGRHWLDVARYSDGHGGFLDNAALPHAWRYRDWVVQAFNADMPYDEFVRQQIAGDLVVDGHQGRVGTGFFALGPTYNSDGGDPDSVAQTKSETLDDRIDTLTRGFMGLTVSCARCHDHKFDPLPQQDYYSLAGIFNNTNNQVAPSASPEQVQAFNNHQAKIKQIQQQIKQKEDQLKQEKREATEEERQQLESWRMELDQLNKSVPPKFDEVHALAEAGSSDMKVAIRGDLRKPGEPAPRRFLRILASEERVLFDQGSGRRQLADAVASADNPLTARVFANRVWMHHFGRALVRTPSNFGSLGESPTHPQLLDWLAATFVESGWSVKQLHRNIMNSSAYRMSSQFDERSFQIDGDNRLLWRMNPRRLGAESWRDTLLAVTGELETQVGGPPTEDVNSRRRTLYFKVSRNGDQFASDWFLRLFDFPLMRASVAKRPTSIVPQQFLFLMNSQFMADRAKALADRLMRESESDELRVEQAYRLLYGRAPSEEERQLGLEFVSAKPDNEGSKLTPWQQYAQVLLSANELMYVR